MSAAQLAGKTFAVKTFGCQMNLHDAERVCGILEAHGLNEVASFEEADVAIFLTCCVRENADTRLYGQASALVSMSAPPSGSRRILAIGGCIAQRDGAALRAEIPHLDIVFGTSAIASLPSLLEEALAGTGERPLVDIGEEDRGFASELPTHRREHFHAWVPIMCGCDNFCTYCIVPYVRGRERSRTMERIVDECARLVADGVREICLLGQNVNSYGRGLYGEPRFAELLGKVADTGIERIRFTSSNPKDLSDATIEAMAAIPAVMPQLHLAVQSGSSRVLKAMNRSYTREEYLDLVRRLRVRMPDIALSTDIIVGFPGETEQDFQDTLSLVEEVGFSSAFTFIYSRREGTVAAKMVDDTPRELIQERFDRLAALVADLAYAANQRDLGNTVEVLVEGPSKRDDSILVGHSPKNQTVHLAVPPAHEASQFIGKLCDVRIAEARTWYLRGDLVGNPR